METPNSQANMYGIKTQAHYLLAEIARPRANAQVSSKSSYIERKLKLMLIIKHTP